MGIFSKNICDLENPRLMGMREKIMEYTPVVKWVPGKTHYIADALSRSPMFDTNEEKYTISCNYQRVQSVWDCIQQGTKSSLYVALQKAVDRRSFYRNCLIQDPTTPALNQTNRGRRYGDSQ